MSIQTCFNERSVLCVDELEYLRWNQYIFLYLLPNSALSNETHVPRYAPMLAYGISCSYMDWLSFNLEFWNLLIAFISILDFGRSHAKKNVFKMNPNSWMLHISWIEYRTNLKVFKHMTKSKELLRIVQKKKINYAGYIRHGEWYEILCLVNEG